MSETEFHTRDEYQAAFDRLIEVARLRICIYDSTLEKAGFDTPARHQRLREFCLAGVTRRIEILLDDTAYLQQQCPRLMTLLRDFSHVIEIRQTEVDSERPAYSFALADRNTWLKCFEKNAVTGQLALDDAISTVLLQQFDQLWQRAPASVSATTLGLG